MNKTIQFLGQVITKNSPTILTGLGVAGLFSTTIMAVKATPKALMLIEDETQKRYYKFRDEEGEYPGLTKKEVVQLTWKLYVPATIMGCATIACIIGANSINLRRNAALASAYSLTEAALREYKEKVVETIGKNKERKIKDDIAKDLIERNPVRNNEVILTGYGETLCYDALSGRYFKSDVEKIRKAFNDVRRDMLTDTNMFVTLNDIYYALGLKDTKMGEVLGWSIENDLLPAFSSQLAEDGTPVLVLDYDTEPRYIYID